MAKLHYCERAPTHFPVVFAGEAYVGEGTVLNVSVSGYAIHSRKRVTPDCHLNPVHGKRRISSRRIS